MVKKRKKTSQKKSTSNKKTTTKKPAKKRLTAREREEILIENFVGIQRAMTNLSEKFSKLSDNLSRLLEVYEEAAKGFVSGENSGTGNTDLIRKIDSILEQNKTIAKGLVLVEEKVKNKSSSDNNDSGDNQSPRPKPLPRT